MIKNQMEQQLKVLEELSGLVDKAEVDGSVDSIDSVTKEDVQHLRDYITDMQRACKTAIAIEERLKPPAKAEPEAPEAPKTAEPKKRKSRAKTSTTKKEAPPKTQETLSDDDLSFLD